MGKLVAGEAGLSGVKAGDMVEGLISGWLGDADNGVVYLRYKESQGNVKTKHTRKQRGRVMQGGRKAFYLTHALPSTGLCRYCSYPITITYSAIEICMNIAG